MTAAGACPGEGVSFLLQKDASIWVSEPGPHRALRPPWGRHPCWEGLLGPAARCFWGWRLSVLWRPSLRGDKLARLRCATPGDTHVYMEMKMNLPGTARVLDLRVIWEFLLFSVPYRQPWGRLEVWVERAGPGSATWPAHLPLLLGVGRFTGSGLWPEEFSVHTGLTKDSGGKKVSFCGDWGFLTEVDIILWMTPQKADRGTRQDLCAFPGWFAADADLLFCPKLTLHAGVLKVAWLGCVIFFPGWPKHLWISELWLLFSVILRKSPSERWAFFGVEGLWEKSKKKTLFLEALSFGLGGLKG